MEAGLRRGGKLIGRGVVRNRCSDWLGCVWARLLEGGAQIGFGVTDWLWFEGAGLKEAELIGGTAGGGALIGGAVGRGGALRRQRLGLVVAWGGGT